MAKRKSSPQSKKGKSSSQARSSASRSTSAAKGKSGSVRSAYMRGARSRGGVGMWGLIGLLSALAVFAVLYFTGTFSKGLAAEISVAEAYALYPDQAFFLDVREVVEWQAGHVPGTTNIPLSVLADRVGELPTGQQIVVVCRSGNRSQEGRDILQAAGFDDVTSMAGGLSDWKDAGYPYDGEILR